MPRTATNEPLGDNFRYAVKTERGHYVMGKSWIDTATPCDAMDYDHTAPIHDLNRQHAERHAMWCADQTRTMGGAQ